jgi:methionyl-tRNA formyltransferase
MKLIFAGTPEFAAVALAALVEADFDIVCVLTQPDRPAGRGLKLQPSAVKLRALEHSLSVLQPASLKEPASQAALRALGADAMVVAAYGLLLPPAVLAIPPLGCLNIHASLLPRWRGAAPIQRAMLAGDRETGTSIMRMDEGLDTGPVLLRERIAIADDDTAGTLHDKLAGLGARCIVRALNEPASAQSQDSTNATYAAKIAKAEAAIDWSQPADAIARRIRAFNPAPGAATTWQGTPLKIWNARPVEGRSEPGTIVRVDADGIVIAAGTGAVKVTELQKAGGKRLTAAAFQGGAMLEIGARLGA